MASIAEIMQLCRLCLVKEQVNVPIFEEQGDIRQIFLKITACLPVKISREDNLPKKICNGCLYKLELLYQFWNTSTNAEKQLLSWLTAAGLDATTQTTQDAMAVVTQTQVVLKQEPNPEITENVTVVSDPGNFILQAAQQPIEFPAVDFDYQDNFTAEQELANNAISADVDDSTESEPVAKRPRRTATATVTAPLIESEDDADDPGEAAVAAKTEEDSDDDTNVEPTFVDVAEDQDGEQPGPSGLGKIVEPSYQFHIKATTSGPEMENSLPFLNKNNSVSKTKEMRKLRRKRKYPHYKKASDERVTEEIYEPIHCDICDKTFENNIAYGLHSVEHNGIKKYSCHMCNYCTALKYNFEMHIKVHEGRTGYKCEICNKAFTVSTHAIEHKNFHTGEKPFKCEFCDKSFMFSWFLSSHRRTQHFEMVTGMKLVKYDCIICNKHYTSATGLKRHKLSKHNTDGIDTSVLCDICGKRLSTKEKLKFHRRIHTGYKPYTCGFCSKSFVRNEQLKEHERVHTGEKPYICQYCGKGFTQRSPLKIHERTHTGERPYICRLCNKGYISKGVMDTHMKSCTGMA